MNEKPTEVPNNLVQGKVPTCFSHMTVTLQAYDNTVLGMIQIDWESRGLSGRAKRSDLTGLFLTIVHITHFDIQQVIQKHRSIKQC